MAALAGAGYCIVPANGTEVGALGSPQFDELTPDMRPQDTYGDGRGWKFETLEHGGDEPDNMPQAIRATDAERALGDVCSAHRGRQDRGRASIDGDQGKVAAAVL